MVFKCFLSFGLSNGNISSSICCSKEICEVYDKIKTRTRVVIVVYMKKYFYHFGDIIEYHIRFSIKQIQNIFVQINSCIPFCEIISHLHYFSYNFSNSYTENHNSNSFIID